MLVSENLDVDGVIFSAVFPDTLYVANAVLVPDTLSGVNSVLIPET